MCSRRDVRVLRKRWVYSKPAADGSFSIPFTSKPARRKASSVTKRWVPCALAGVATTAVSVRSGARPLLLRGFGRFERVRMASRSEPRKRATSSPPGTVVSPTWTAKSGAERGPESRRLKDRRTDHDGSPATASASNPNRSSPPRSATTEGYQSTGVSFSSWNDRTG